MSMRRTCLVTLTFFSLSQIGISQTSIESQSVIIWGASIEGKQLVVTGGAFQEGAVVILNGKIQKTKIDPDFPTRNLRAKNAARRIAPDEIAFVQVQGTDGQLSDEVPVYGGINVFWTPLQYWAINLKKEQRFLLYLTNFSSPQFTWHYSIDRQAIIQTVEEAQISGLSPGAVAQVFEAVGTGVTGLYAIGYVPCSGLGCPAAPPFQLAVNISVK